jgi:hypothetical protein
VAIAVLRQQMDWRFALADQDFIHASVCPRDEGPILGRRARFR